MVIMHPLVKLLALIVLCQILQLAYEMRDTHKLHGSKLLWYWAKFTPLILAVASSCYVLLQLMGVRLWLW